MLLHAVVMGQTCAQLQVHLPAPLSVRAQHQQQLQRRVALLLLVATQVPMMAFGASEHLSLLNQSQGGIYMEGHTNYAGFTLVLV